MLITIKEREVITMVTIATGNMGDCEAFITDEADLDELRDRFGDGSKALNLNNRDLWVLRSDNLWQKVGSGVTR